jgi:signal transduction histidine kinase
MLHHSHNAVLIYISIFIAVFASYTALDLVSSLTLARGRARWAWLLGGSLVMGVGIWSMHFVGMLAFSIPGVTISYDIFLLILSIVVAIAASMLSLHVLSRETLTTISYVSGSIAMGAAISGMHYIGIASMRMNADCEWNRSLVVLSILIAAVSSFVALRVAFRFRKDVSRRGIWSRVFGGVFLGTAISGMHYCAMAAMTFIPVEYSSSSAGNSGSSGNVLADFALAVAVIITTLILLGITVIGSIVDRALSRQVIMAEQALQQARQEQILRQESEEIRKALDGAICARDEFLSIASHELKTPLTSLKLQTQMREMKLKKKDHNYFTVENLEKMFAIDVKQIDRIAKLVDDMLDISRISAGKIQIQKEEFDICSLVQDLTHRFSAYIDASNTQLEIQCDKPIVLGNWDRFRVEQVITNLLTNALRYGDHKPVHISIIDKNDKVQLIVRDQGIGIAKENHDRIFQRFERAISPSEISGLGLGLYIVKKIVEMHDGTIWVESELGKGATFIVELPVS